MNTSSSSTTTTTTSVQEPVYNDYVVEGLTVFEMYREPRAPVTDDSTTTMPIRILNKDLSCPICLNIIHSTLTVMECLHRFCSGCVEKSLRLGKKECPTCRIPVPSRRNLRPDPNFDALIRVLYPNLAQYEQQEETFIQQINNEYAVRAATVEESMKRQKAAAKRERAPMEYKEKKKEEKKEPKPKKTKPDFPSVPTPVPKISQPALKAPANPPEDVSIAIAPYPGEKTLAYLPRPFLRIPAAASVKHVYKFLALKFPTIDPSTLRVILGTGVSDSVKFAKAEKDGITVNLEDISVVIKENKGLSEDTPLPTVKAAWKRKDEILLLYYIQPKDTNNTDTQEQPPSNDLKISIMTVR